MILPDCTIVIPTRNRPDELEETARLLCERGLADTPIIVVDDASDEPNATQAAVVNLKNCRVVKQARRTGQAGARNAGLRTASTTYVLLLDDDAHPDNPEALGAFLQKPREEDTAVWRFETIRERDGYRDGIPEKFPASRVSGFIGFGALLHRERILDVGGFRDVLMYRGEENDLAIRLFRANLQIQYVPGIRFIHRHQAVRDKAFEREYARMTTRNIVLYYGLNYPLVCGISQGLARGLKDCAMASQFRYAKITGLAQGISVLAREWHQRTPLSWSQMRAYKTFRDAEMVQLKACRTATDDSRSGDKREGNATR